MAGETKNTKLPLEGIRVIDLTMWFQGPVAGQHLADLGAEVIHFENPKGGDLARGIVVQIRMCTLPLLGPAATLVGDIVGVGANNDHLVALVERQNPVVLQQHQ